MFEIILYKNSAESNRVDKASALTGALSFNGTLRDECSIIDPVIRITSTSIIMGYNYAYIPLFNRYYFINNISAPCNGAWDIVMHVDVLMSFKKQLYKLEGMIGRNQYDFDPYLNDLCMPFKQTVTLNEQSAYSWFYGSLNSPRDYSVIVNAVSNDVVDEETSEGDRTAYNCWAPYPGSSRNSTSKTIVTYILHGYTLIKSFVEWLLSSEGGEQAASYIVSVYLMPCGDVSGTLEDDGYNNIYIGGRKGFKQLNSSTDTKVRIRIGYKYVHLDCKNSTMFCSTSNAYIRFIERRCFNIGGGFSVNFPKDFTRYSPRSIYQLYVPWIGWVDIDSQLLFAVTDNPYGIVIVINVDPSNGEGLFTIMIQDYEGNKNSCRLVCYKSAPFLLPLPVSFTSADAVSRQHSANVLNLISGILGGAVQAGSGIAGTAIGQQQKNARMTMGGVDSIAQGATGIITAGLSYAANEKLNIEMGGASQVSSCLNNQFINKKYVFRHILQEKLYNDEELKQYAKLVGRPCKKVKSLNNLRGFTVMDEIHLDGIVATSTECEEIDTLCKQGILFPD